MLYSHELGTPRIQVHSETTGSQTYSFAYTYNRLGLASVVTTGYDGAGRVLSLSGALNGAMTTYIAAIGYAPQGAAIFDNGSSHRGQRADQRLQSRWPAIIPVHTPGHASWLNQVEIYFSIVQRKALTPSDFSDLAELEAALLAFQYRYEKFGVPFR